jgi:hypothetical protein
MRDAAPSVRGEEPAARRSFTAYRGAASCIVPRCMEHAWWLGPAGPICTTHRAAALVPGTQVERRERRKSPR